ncbi:MAG TPA: hypothetical protein VEJ18_15440 [Planctomycetota bacterium]|nr:hypothetical protein [Planctomycetota bacterium]
MTHPTDDELLELALLRGEPDAPSNAHVRDCPACAARFDAVLSEQDLLRAAFAPTAAPARPRRSLLGAVAAALIVGVLTGIAITRATPTPPRTSPVSLDQAAIALRSIPAQIRTLRDADPARLEDEYPKVLSRAEALYADFLEAYLDGTSPLSESQRADLRQAVETVFARVWTEQDAEKLAESFCGALRTSLNPEQFEALRARLRLDMESDWEDEIAIVTEDVSEALDLRHREVERLRDALRARYPKTELPMLSLAQWPPDRLAEDRALADAVRGALEEGYRPGFDAYLTSLRTGRRRAEQAARAFASGQGR